MEFGIFHEFPARGAGNDARALDEGFELVDGAERWGLDAVWLAELHFDPERSVASAPLCLAAAIAARTERVKIGIGVQVLPLCHPLRLAEETATIDQISRGRLILGVGRSGVARTYEAHGIPYAESRARFAEVLEVLRGAWSRTDFAHDGTYFRFDPVTTTPRPFTPSGPPIRVAATSPSSCAAIGRQGFPIFVGVRHEPASHLAPMIAAYRAAWRAAGHPGAGQVYVRFPAYLAATEAQARADAEASLIHYYRAQGALLADSARRAGVAEADERARQAKVLERITFEEASRGLVLIGTPDSVSARLAKVRAELGIDGILAELDCGGRVPHAEVKTALRLLCEDVKPRFQ
ncbi:MAG: LLM class flavin-dependent oxidoreductase [Rhodospirillales bacterium]|nr:LLM class flavin-dependent oxidoreductase [Rhodospirillales bacterium]